MLQYWVVAAVLLLQLLLPLLPRHATLQPGPLLRQRAAVW
jgi:hypothetical protein